jgi:hypothetical protein
LTLATLAPSCREKASPAGTSSKADHVSTDRPARTVSATIAASSRVPACWRRWSWRTSTSHSVTRGSPAEFHQQNPAAAGVPSAASTSRAWSLNWTGSALANAM